MRGIRHGLLLQMQCGLCICVFGALGVEILGPKEPCNRWDPDRPGKGQFGVVDVASCCHLRSSGSA